MKKLLFITLLSAGCGQEVYQEKLIKGDAGSNGLDGYNGLLSTLRFTSDASVCASEAGVFVKTGLDMNRNNVLDLSEVQDSEVVCDGANGEDAPNQQYGIVNIIDPCGASGGHDEVLLKLANGTIIASFSNNAAGNMTRFSILKAGVNYITTDNSGCFFSIDTNGNIYNEHH